MALALSGSTEEGIGNDVKVGVGRIGGGAFACGATTGTGRLSR